MRRFYLFHIFVLLMLGMLISPVKSAQKQENQENVLEKSTFGFNELILSIENQKETVSGEEIKEWEIIQSSLLRNSEDRSEIENIRFCPGDPIICRMVFGLREMFFLKKKAVVLINEEKINTFVEELAKRIDKEPANAKFKMEDSGIVNFTPDEEGIKINVSESVDIIKKNLRESDSSQTTKEIALSYEKTEPEIKSSDVNNFGIETLIGEGTSNFRGSPKNRIFNINVAAEKFNGVLIKPGEEFSFVKTLGPVDGEHGYAPELVIKHDKTEPEFGGGICQVSTTAFRAAINSGLKITARRNHAYPVAYYNPQGMDATVYIPRPDLKFINNTPGNILIQTKIEGTILTFQFYGTSDGRKVEIVGPKVIEKNPDGSMKTTFTQSVYSENGDVIISDDFKSNYDSPSKYPHPGEEKITKKPKNWSDKEWEKYKKTIGM